MGKRLLTLRDLCAHAQVSRWSIYRWRRGYPDFPATIRLGSGVRPRFFEEEFEAWLLNRRKQRGDHR